MTKVLASKIESFENALDRLSESLDEPKSEFIRDSVIKRFELLYEVTWKALKELIWEEHGIEVRSPRATFKEAYTQGIIEYDSKWMDIVLLRNKTTHTYVEKLAEQAYEEIIEHFNLFQNLRSYFEQLKSSS